MSIEKQINIKVQATGTEKAIAQTDKLKSKLKQLDSATGDVAKGMKASSMSVLENGGAMGLLNDATGGVAMTIKDAVEATGLFTKGTTIATIAQKAYTFVVGTTTGALKALRLALAATGIGAIVVALGFLIEKLMSSTDATEEQIKAQEQLNIVLDETNKLYKESVSNIDEVTKVRLLRAKIAGKSEAELLAIEKDAGKQREAEYQAEKQRLLDLLNDKDVGVEEAKKINQALSDNQKAYLKSLDDEQIKSLEKELSVADKRREQQKANEQKRKEDAVQAEKDRIDAIKKLREEEEKENQEYWAKYLEISTERNKTQMDNDKAMRDFDLETTTAINNDKLKILKDRTDKEIEIEKVVSEAKKQIQDSQINNIGQGIALLGSFAGKNKKLQAAAIIAENAVGIAKSIIASNAAIPAINLKYAPIPGGAALAAAEITANKISTGLSVASSIAATAKALQSLGGGSGGGGSSQSSTGGGSSVPSAPSFNLVAGTGTNQIAQGLASGQSQPIQAYVVSGAVTSGQSLDRNIVNDASI